MIIKLKSKCIIYLASVSGLLSGVVDARSDSIVTAIYHIFMNEKIVKIESNWEQ